MKNFPHKRIFSTLILVLTTVLTVQLVQNPFFNRARADEIKIPAGYTVLQYMEALEQADFNSDGVINLFDYSNFYDQGYGESGAYQQTDVNFDQKTNAIDASFVLNNFLTNVQDIRESIFSNEKYAKELNLEIARRNEDAIPNAQDTGVLSTTSAEGGSEKQYGRNVIPQVLGTVSAYSGSAGYGLDFDVPAGPGGIKPAVGLTYSSQSIDDARDQGSDGGKPFYTLQERYTPFQAGYGFSLTGLGSIMRDTKEEKEVYKLKGKMYHRFILSLPGGISAELRYNPTTGRWASIPQSFLKIEHEAAGTKSAAPINGLTFLDGDDWVITTKDGTSYYFGEENIASKIGPDGAIADSKPVTDKGNILGTEGGNSYIEFDKANLCEGSSETNPCSKRERNGKVVMVTKWLLRKIQSSDGKTVNYTYDSTQKYLEKKWGDTNLLYITGNGTTYPREISWNDGKHRVRFEKEDRPDMGYQGYMRKRIKEVLVETKTQNDNAYHIVRKYALGYFNLADKTKDKLGEKAGSGKGSAEGIANGFGASFLTSVQEYGKNGEQALPPVTFRYIQYAFPPQNYHGGEIYLASINNGYGGETRFAYQPFEIGAISPSGKPAGIKNRRVRVIEKQVVDRVANKSFRETYDYGQTYLFEENFRKSPVGEGGTAQEYLGHASVEVKQYDFDNTLLGHTETFFNQANTAVGCFEPHPAKGRPYRSVVYKGASKDIAQETQTVFRYRFDGKDGQDPSNGCNKDRMNQPIFLYGYDTTKTTREAAKDFVPSAFKNYVKTGGKSEVRTLERLLAHDEYGNPTLSVNYGEVDAKGNDVDTSDNKYSHATFLTSGAKWIKGLPHITYTSNSQTCDVDDLSCQWGRSKLYYDLFSKNYWEAKAEDLEPTYGLLTQKETWVDGSNVMVEGYVYDDLSGNSNDTDVRKGEVTQTYAPKAGLKTVRDPKKDIILMSQKEFDPYYHTLILSEKNALGHRVLLENYDPLLQVPTTLKTQIQSNPDSFSVARMEFDSLGRMTAGFSPDPDRPGSTLSEPAKISAFFERGDLGLVVRTAEMVSQTPDGTKQYQVSDQFYDGIGQVRQSQVLQTSVDGKDLRKVAINDYHADGTSTESYEIQTASPVTVGPINAGNYKTILGSVQPEYLPNVAKVTIAETKFDVLRRPISSTQIETGSGQKYTSTSEYGLFTTKSVDPKGVEKITITDVWGRPRFAFAQEVSKKKSLMTMSEYEKLMVDQPTKTTIVDNAGTKVTSTFDYDRSGRLLSSDDPSLGFYKFVYDIYGNKLEEVSPGREDSAYTYDMLGRLITKTYLGMGDGEMYNGVNKDTVSWTYDQGANALGKLSKVDHLTGSKTFAYDSGQRLVSTKVKTLTNEKEFKTSFNSLSQEASSTYPDNTVVKKEYDREGRVQKMLVNNKDVFLGSVYDKFGRAKNALVTYNGNQYTSTNTFDTMGRLTGLDMKKRQLADGAGNYVESSIFNQSLKYNAVAEIQQLTDKVLGTSTTFDYTYDSFSQLASVASPLYNTSYEYDMFGRMTKKNEKENVAMKYTNDQKDFPFFAPKSVTITGEDDITDPIKKPKEGGPNTLGVTTRTTNLEYTKKGAMKFDEKNCYFYNRESQLIKLGMKKTRTAACVDENYKKILKFYYDEEGAMNLQEEYLPEDMKKPLKQLYLFGVYEEEVTP